MPRTAAGDHRDAPDRDGPPPDRPSIARGPRTADAPHRERPTSNVDAADPPSVSFAATAATGRERRHRRADPWGRKAMRMTASDRGCPGAMLLGGRAGSRRREPVPDHRRADPPAAPARRHADARSSQRVARRGRHGSRRARRRGSRLRQDDAPRRLGPQQRAPDGVVPARSGRSRLAHVLPASRRERPRARSGVRAGHATPCCCDLGPAVRPEPTSRRALCANTPSSARAIRRD